MEERPGKEERAGRRGFRSLHRGGGRGARRAGPPQTSIAFWLCALLFPTCIAPATTQGNRSQRTRTSHVQLRGTESIRQK